MRSPSGVDWVKRHQKSLIENVCKPFSCLSKKVNRELSTVKKGCVGLKLAKSCKLDCFIFRMPGGKYLGQSISKFLRLPGKLNDATQQINAC